MQEITGPHSRYDAYLTETQGVKSTYTQAAWQHGPLSSDPPDDEATRAIREKAATRDLEAARTLSTLT